MTGTPATGVSRIVNLNTTSLVEGAGKTCGVSTGVANIGEDRAGGVCVLVGVSVVVSLGVAVGVAVAVTVGLLVYVAVGETVNVDAGVCVGVVVEVADEVCEAVAVGV